MDEWRYRPLTCEYPYVYIDGIYLKRSWGGSYGNVAVMVAIGVNGDGYREVIGYAEGFTESKECWQGFLSWLKSRGLRGVRMFTGDKAAGMVGSIAEAFPNARYQRCTVRFYRNALAKIPKSKRSQVAAMPKTIHAMESRETSAAKAESVADELESMKLKEAAKVDVLRDAPRALAAHPHEQRHRAAQQGDQAQDPRGRHVPRQEIRTDAGAHLPEVRRGQRMELPPILGRVSAQRVAVPGAG